MKSLVIAFAATMCLAAPAFAQDAGAGAPPAADAGAAAGGGKGGKMKQAIQACRTEIQSQNLKGPDRKKAIEDCVTKEHPELAGRMACRDEAKSKGLSGDEMKSYIKTCAKAARNHG